MALQKSKTLASGESGNYWRVSNMRFSRADMSLEIEVALYKDATLAASGSSPLPFSYKFRFTITQQEIVGNLVAMAYTKIKAAVAELHTPISGSGDPVSYYPDLVGATDV